MATAMRGGSARDTDASQFLKKWITVWVALLAIVTLVVVVFLVTITNSLASINGSLAVADEAVSGAGGDVVTLPSAVDTVNASLGGIDPNLKPIPGQADAIIGSLRSINDKLTNVDRSLVDTSSVLSTVLGQTGTISGILVDADDPPDGFGVQNIHQRVAIANGILTPAEADARAILAGLGQVNANLLSICSTGVLTLPVVIPAGPC